MAEPAVIGQEAEEELRGVPAHSDDGLPVSIIRRSRTAGQDGTPYIEQASPLQPEAIRTAGDDGEDAVPPAEKPAATEPTGPAWLAHVRDVPLEDLLANHEPLRQHVAGVIGSEAQRHARAQIAQAVPAIQTQALARARQEVEDAELAREEARIERLADDDAFAYREGRSALAVRQKEIADRRGQETAQSAQAAAARVVADRQLQAHLKPLTDQLTYEDAVMLASRPYAETYGPGVPAALAYQRDAYQILADRRVEAERAEGARRLRETEKAVSVAARKEALTERNAGDSPNLGGGGKPSASMTWQQFLAKPLDERLRFKKEFPSQYQVISATG